MTKYSKRPPVRHGLFGLPLFDWALRRDVPPFTTGGRWVHRRTGLPPTMANTIAELAGISSEPTR